MTNPTFTDSQFMTAEEKQKVFTSYVKFVESGFDQKKFSKALYKYLSLNFSFIAHYNQEGFFLTRFQDPVNRVKTFEQLVNASPWEFTPEPHRTGDLNKAVHDYTVQNAHLYLETARIERVAALKETIAEAQNELRRLGGN